MCRISTRASASGAHGNVTVRHTGVCRGGTNLARTVFPWFGEGNRNGETTGVKTMAKIATDDDYSKFKKFLRFFVRQAEKNARNGEVEKPTRNKQGAMLDKDNPDFWRHYELASDFNKIAGVNFIMRFFMLGHFGTERSTYINVSLLDITGVFKNKRITALQNHIRLDIPSGGIEGDLRKECVEWNRKSHPYSIESLGINNDNNDPPNDLLKRMLNEYLDMYNNFYERIKVKFP